MLPPPTPFKLFVLAASAFEMKLTHFFAAVFAGRFVRFLVLSLLTIEFGPGVIHLIANLARQHAGWLATGIAAILIVSFLVWRLIRQRQRKAVISPDAK